MKSVTIFLLIAISLLLLLLNSCAHISTDFFSIEIPPDWQVTKHTANEVTLWRKNVRNVEIYITASRVPNGLTLEENWRDYYNFIIKNKKVINQFEKKYNGVDWKGVTTEEINIEMVDMFTIKNNVRCMIFYGTEKNDFEKHYNEFQTFMRSVKLVSKRAEKK